MMKKTMVSLSFCTLFLMSPITLAIDLKFGHNTTPDGPTGKYIQMFSDEVSKASNGDIKIKVFPNSQLGSATEMMDQVKNGLLDFTKPDSMTMENMQALYKAINYPFVFKDTQQQFHALSSESGMKILNSTSQMGLKGLGYLMMTSRGYYSTKPINTLADLKGRKMRVQESNTILTLVKTVDAVPIPIPYGETYSALQQGMVDSVEGALGPMVTQRHGEIAKYYFEDNHIIPANLIVISSRSWDKLSDSHKKIISDAARKIMDFSYKKGIEMEAFYSDQAQTKMKVKVVKISENERQKLVLSLKDFYEKLKTESPQAYQIMEALRNTP